MTQWVGSPKSVFSWDYQVNGPSAGPAELTFNFFTEQGLIHVHDQQLQIEKQGFMSGHWIMRRNGTFAAEAKKPNAFFRSFDLRHGQGDWTLRARSPFTRAFELVSGPTVVGTISPAHPFTRRSFLECRPTVPDEVRLFGFWLVVLSWRRARRNRNNG